VRFSLTLDKEPEIEEALGWTSRVHDLLMDLHATDVVGSSAYASIWRRRISATSSSGSYPSVGERRIFRLS